MTSVAVCACGRRLESDWKTPDGLMMSLRTPGHDPDECSRQIGYQGRFDGRAEMVEPVMDHLSARGSLAGRELAETRAELLGLVHSIPLGPVKR